MLVALHPNFSSAPLSQKKAEELPTVKILSPVRLVEDYIGKDYARYPRPIALPAIFHSSTPFTEEASEVNFPHIYKNMQEYPKNFIYGGKSVYERFQKVFDTIAVLEGDAEKLEKAGNEKALEKLEKEIDNVKKPLSESIKLVFLDFLHTQLGDERRHLIPVILSQFSLKANTSSVAQLSHYTQNEFNSILVSHPGTTKRNIELLIPPQKSENPIQIISDLSFNCIEQCAIAQNVSLDPKIQMVAKGVFSIPLQRQAQHDVAISLTSL